MDPIFDSVENRYTPTFDGTGFYPVSRRDAEEVFSASEALRWMRLEPWGHLKNEVQEGVEDLEATTKKYKFSIPESIQLNFDKIRQGIFPNEEGLKKCQNFADKILYKLDDIAFESGVQKFKKRLEKDAKSLRKLDKYKITKQSKTGKNGKYLRKCLRKVGKVQNRYNFPGEIQKWEITIYSSIKSKNLSRTYKAMLNLIEEKIKKI